MYVVCITHKSSLPQWSIFVGHFFGSLNLALGRSQTTKMLSRFRPGTEIAIGGGPPLSCVKLQLFWQFEKVVYRRKSQTRIWNPTGTSFKFCAYRILVAITNGPSLLSWVDLIHEGKIRSQMNLVFWFFWLTRWVKQQQGKILWCKRCTITSHIIQQSTRWPQPVNILDCIDWPTLHMSPSRPLANKCSLAINKT